MKTGFKLVREYYDSLDGYPAGKEYKNAEAANVGTTVIFKAPKPISEAEANSWTARQLAFIVEAQRSGKDLNVNLETGEISIAEP